MLICKKFKLEDMPAYVRISTSVCMRLAQYYSHKKTQKVTKINPKSFPGVSGV